MGCRKIVAVEFFFIRTFLLPDIDRAPHRHHAHQILERPRHGNAQLLRAGIRRVRIIDRRLRLARKDPQMRRCHLANRGAMRQAQRLIEFPSDLGIRPGIEIHAGILRTGYPFHEQRHAAGQRSRREHAPHVYARGPLMWPGDEARVRVGGVERIDGEQSQSQIVQRQDGHKAFAHRRGRIESGFARHREHAVGIIAQDALHIGGFGQSRNAEARLRHQIFDHGLAGAEQNQVPGNPIGIQFIQLMLAVPVRYPVVQVESDWCFRHPLPRFLRFEKP